MTGYVFRCATCADIRKNNTPFNFVVFDGVILMEDTVSFTEANRHLEETKRTHVILIEQADIDPEKIGAE